LPYNGVAVCSVDGGPDYEVPILGESSFVDFRLSTHELDYGEVPYNESSSKEFFIENIGKVPYEFSINLSTVSRPGIIECSHMSGKVIAGERFKVVVKFFPGVPANIDEMLLVECGHFPAARFKIKAVGIYPGCLLSFPRAGDEELQGRLERARARREPGEEATQYAATFSGSEAVRLMPALPSKLPERERALIKEPQAMEVEAEAERELLCDKIVAKLEQAQAPAQGLAQTSGSGFGGTAARDATGSAGQGAPGRRAAAGRQGSTKKPANAAAGAGASPDGGANLQGGAGAVSAVNLEGIQLATYLCDFGDVVVGATRRKSFRLTNVGRVPVTFNFDKKLLTQAGIAIEPDKAQKLAPAASALYTVVFATRKNAKFGRQRYHVPIDVKGGPSYLIEFAANLTIPELAMSSETLDFGKVCVQTRKTVKVRFENLKEVACDWSYHYKPDVAAAAAAAKEGERFQVFPLSGTLLPGQRQTVDVMFTPNSDKPFLQKLNFRCKDNPKQFVLNVKGQGIHYQVDLVPETTHLGPVLPYDTSAVQCIELRNPMDQAIEVLSQDFDSQFLAEEEILKRLEQFQGVQPEPLFLPLRAPGGEFWSSLREQDDRRRRGEELREQLSAVDSELAQLDKEEQALGQPAKEAEQEGDAPAGEEPAKTQEEISERKSELMEQKGKLEATLAEEQEDHLEVKYPAPVKEEDKLNLVIIGPEKCGKTTLANYLAQEHQRAVVRLDQLHDWCLKRGSQLAEEAAKFLEDRQEELNVALAEQEKRKKAKKKGKDEEPDVNPDEFKYLSKDILSRMLRERLAQEDCNAGAIFDCLESEYWPDAKFAVELICEAVPEQNLQVILLRFQRDQAEADGEEEPAEVCTNYRFARRQAAAAKGGRGEDGVAGEGDAEAKRAAKSRAAPAKGAKRGGKGASKEDEEKPAEQAEAERRLLEDEERKRQEEAAREQQRPKDYTAEDVEEYQRYADEMEQFFGGLTMRQLGGGAEPDAKSGSGEEANPGQEGVEPGTPENDQPEEGAGENASAAEEV
jgi:hydrocephalus-inducing protein